MRMCLIIMQNTFSVATNKEALCRLVEVTTLIRSDERKANDRKTDSDKFVSYSPFCDVHATNCRTYTWGAMSIAQWLERRTRVPEGAAGELFSSPGSTFCAGSYFGIRSTPVLPQSPVKYSGHSTKSAGGRLQLNTDTRYIPMWLGMK